jgi:outer membrane immunogenic protein
LIASAISTSTLDQNEANRSWRNKMKKILLGTIGAVALGMAAPAVAADLPQRMPAAAPAVMMPYVYDWTGFYIGGNGGWGSSRNCWGNFTNFIVPEGCNSRSGGMIGGQGGYRWQAGQFVFGLAGPWTQRCSI